MFDEFRKSAIHSEADCGAVNYLPIVRNVSKDFSKNFSKMILKVPKGRLNNRPPRHAGGIST
jgi:hypothetical protein